MNSLFEASWITKDMQGRRVVDQVSLTLSAGELLALVGESGAGKSTLLSILACLLPADAGELRLSGTEISDSAVYLIPGHADIKLVPQEFKLLPNHTLRENIAYALREYTKEYQRERLDELIALTGLGAVQHKLPREVSGGEKQRTAIARAIADEPKVLLLDEPFSSLDTLNKQKLKQELLRIVRETGVACLFVTHDLLDALTVADRLGVMYQGKLLQTGTVSDLLREPADAYVKSFLSSGLTILEDVRRRLEG
ncbi:MAG: ATP-binding cassette domain-containing protein [Siphonobacter aquaeclarae]|nr:ATP-binding cassette domain-containing protein [Siphonobacter aquaeclarae]